MKKSIAFVLSLLLLLSLFTACGEDAPSSSTDTSASPSASATDEDSSASSFDCSAPLTEEGFFEGITASELVTLPDYKGITIDASVLTASQEDIDANIDSVLDAQAVDEQIMDRAVENGDTLNIDYVGSIDGVEFSGGSTEGQGTEVTIGVTSYIDDFLEQLIGHMPGETFDIEVTFPDPYENNPDLAGKDATFTVTINYIVGDLIVPETLTDEIAAQYGFSTVEELTNDIENWLISNQKTSYFKELLQQSEVSEIPQSILDYLQEADLAYYEEAAATYGVSVETLLSVETGYSTVEDYVASQEDFYRETATFYLACQAIAEIEGLRATDEDVENSIYVNYISAYGEPYIRMCVLQEIVCRDFIFDNAVIQ